MSNSYQTEILVDEDGDVVADIEDQPDRDKSYDTVDIGLQKILEDITIEQFHFFGANSKAAQATVHVAERFRPVELGI